MPPATPDLGAEAAIPHPTGRRPDPEPAAPGGEAAASAGRGAEAHQRPRFDSSAARWVVALSLLAALALTGFLLVDEQLRLDEADEGVVQATTATRAEALEALLHANHAADPGVPLGQRRAAQERLRTTLALLEANHEALVRGRLPGEPAEAAEPGGALPAGVAAVYFEAPHHLDAQVRAFLRDGFALAEEPGEVVPGDARLLAMRGQVDAISAGVDAAIVAYRAEEAAGRSLVRGFQVWTLATSLLMLGVVAAFVFRPMEQRIQREVDLLRELNATLERRVAERTAEAEARAQELARSNADLEQFAYVASHDLQEPLRMVASYAQLLQRRYGGRLDEDADEYIAYAVEGARRMQHLIDDLLAFSRVGSTGAEPRFVDAGHALDDALKALEAAVKESGARVTRGPLPVVPADPTQLAQVFQNLVGNAIKFRGKAAPEVRVEAVREGRLWHFRVQDNGMGIAPEHRHRIFQLFQRLHPRGRVPGTGIGLAICQRIVTRHGGEIWVESPGEGRGSTFHFTLAAETEAARAAAEAAESGEAPTARERIAQRAEDVV